jgi:hypothetical protein
LIPFPFFVGVGATSLSSWLPHAFGLVSCCVVLDSFAEVRVPIVLDFIVSPAWQPSCNERPTVAKKRMQPNDQVILIRSDVPSLDIGPKVVHPS